MKILLTGTTSIQCGKRSSRSKQDYISFPYLLKDMLTLLGHDVYHKVYDPRIDVLSDYDVALIGLAPSSSIASCFCYNAFLAMSHPNKLFYLVDWDVKNAFSTRIKNDPFHDFIMGINRLKLEKEDIRSIINNVEWFFGVKHNVLGQLANWGDHSLVKKNTLIDNLIAFDPAPYLLRTLKQCELNYNTKKKVWVSASLRDFTEKLVKLNLKWDMQIYTKANYISEVDLVEQVYANSWGTLALPYYHKGSGWHRGRFIFAMHTGCIMLANKKEVEPLGDAYVFDVDFYENKATCKQLKELADAQREAYMKFMLSFDDTVSHLETIIENVCKGG